jgi:hypothetical protein
VKKSDPNASPDTWIWHFYKTVGYVTLFGSELCNIAYTGKARQGASGIEKFFHRDAEPADHIASYPFCPIGGDSNTNNPHVMPFNPVSATIAGRCLNGKPSWRLVMDYLEQFETNYEDVGRFSTFTVMAGHEPSQHVVKLLDVDLRDYLKKRLANPNTVTFLLGDHGLHYGPFSQTARGQMEAKMPFLKLVVPNSLLRRHPHLEGVLLANRDALVTAYDLYATLKHIAVYPEPPPRVPPWSYSLLWPIPADRSCADAGVSVQECVCSEWEDWDEGIPEVQQGAALATYYLNEMITHAKLASERGGGDATGGGVACSTLGLRRIVSAKASTITFKLLGSSNNDDADSTYDMGWR